MYRRLACWRGLNPRAYQRTRYIRQTVVGHTVCCRNTSDGRRPGFFSKLIEDVKQEMAKNKEMKESLKKFREEAQKLEQSDALQKARMKFHAVESEASKSSEVLKEKLDTLKGKVSDVLEEAGKSEIAKKAGQIGAEIGKTARGAAESLSERGQQIGKTGAFQKISETAAAVKKELDQGGMQAHVYQSPMKLRRRVETVVDPKVMKPDTESLGIEVHKDSKFYQSWQQFKENNPYINKVLDWKIKYDESDNPVIRASRVLTEKVSDIMGGLFQKTELSETLTEICKLDPNFDKVQFLRDCEKDIIPNILEAMIQGNLEILKDWCHEGPYNVLSTPIKQAQSLKYRFCSKILDIDNVDLVMGKVMDQGPVLVINFTSQQILCLQDQKGNVVEGDPNKVLRVNYVWVLCRDPSELNPRAAWRLLDLSASSNEQLL
ncbi:mitochondrial import inner membrane translocase subunit TIM44 [Cimex lectularius]|uniref:Mitochondrial import inner membrane translocase subunit TIM44 n=1 Tax=Cimex lectularius TaxID=79782 RepID=A0A8I6S1L3_CIMLE|nr:mitochondrial import inner membrane translocase subunit TIM44 [Cimex lectularius]